MFAARGSQRSQIIHSQGLRGEFSKHSLQIFRAFYTQESLFWGQAASGLYKERDKDNCQVTEPPRSAGTYPTVLPVPISSASLRPHHLRGYASKPQKQWKSRLELKTILKDHRANKQAAKLETSLQQQGQDASLQTL